VGNQRAHHASDEPSLGFRPSEKILEPALITAQGALSAPKRTIAHPSEVDPKSKAKRYRIPAISNSLFLKSTCNLMRDIFQPLSRLGYALWTLTS
jgi:hypothetical protein